jgi:hypothetical protein
MASNVRKGDDTSPHEHQGDHDPDGERNPPEFA